MHPSQPARAGRLTNNPPPRPAPGRSLRAWLRCLPIQTAKIKIGLGVKVNERAHRIRPSPAQCSNLKKTRSAFVHFAKSSRWLRSLSCHRAMVYLDFPLKQNRCFSVAVTQMHVACPYSAIHIHIWPCLLTMPVGWASSQEKDGLASCVGTQMPPANTVLPEHTRPSEPGFGPHLIRDRGAQRSSESLRITLVGAQRAFTRGCFQCPGQRFPYFSWRDSSSFRLPTPLFSLRPATTSFPSSTLSSFLFFCGF